MRREGGKKKRVLGMACLVRVLIREKPRKRNIKEGESLKGEGDFSDKECYYCKKKGHIQMMYKEFKEDLKRIKT